MASALSALALVFVSGEALAGVVVSASGPSAGSYPVGRKLADNERIVLQAGDTLTVLDGRGTRVLRGAGTYSLDQQAGPGARGTFAVLTERRSAQRVRTGAVRTGADDAPVHAPNLWYVDVGRTGTICLADKDRVRLWRAATQDKAAYVISGVAQGESQTVTFGEGDMLAPWNARALPLVAGSPYRLARADGTSVNEVSFVVLDEVAEEPEALAEQLIGNGCLVQLELLSTATMQAEG